MNVLPSPRILEGEILSPSAMVRVVGNPHPLRTARVDVLLPAGPSIRDLIAQASLEHGSSIPLGYVAYLDGNPIKEEYLHCVKPKPGTTLVFKATVAGSGALRSILGIALAVVALVVAGPLASALFPMFAAGSMGLALATAAIGAAITFGGQYLLQTLFPVAEPQLDVSDESQARSPTYSIGGGRNRATQYGSIPVILGRHRVNPIYASAPFTEIIGDDQYLRLLFLWGYGPLEVTDIRIGETPITRFEGVEIQTVGTYDDEDAPLTLFPKEAFEEQLSILLDYNVGNIRRTAPDIDEISVDVTAPNGLFEVDKTTGDFRFWMVDWTMRYRKVGDATWTSLPFIRMQSKEQKVLRKAARAKVPRGQYDVEVKRITIHYPPSGPNQVSEDLVWTALRGFRNENPIQMTKPVTVTALRIRATEQLNGTIDTLNGIVRSRQRVWNGTSWEVDFSSNPAALYRAVLQHQGNARPVPTARIDLAALQGWHDYCNWKGFRFNQVRENTSSIWDTLRDICAAGRAVPTMKDGLFSVMWDAENLPIQQVFSARDVWGFSGEMVYRNLPHALRCRYINEDRNFVQDERIVYNDGYNAGNATLFESVEFPGVTDKGLIYKHGRYHLAQAKLRPAIYSFKTGFEHIVCSRGDRVLVQHDSILWGQIAARVKTADDLTQAVTLDEAIQMLPDTNYVLRVRLNDGTILLYDVANTASEIPPGQSVFLAGQVPVTTLIGALATFGERTKDAITCRVLSITPSDDMTATVTLVDDAPGIQLADTGPIPEYDSQISDPIDPLKNIPSDLQVIEFIYGTSSGWVTGAHLTWTMVRIGATIAYEIQHRFDDGDQVWRHVATVPFSQFTVDALELAPGIHSFRVRARFGDGTVSGWRNALYLPLRLLLTKPPNPSWFRINVLGDTSLLSWEAVTIVTLSHYQIRFTPMTSGALWSTAQILVEAVEASQITVPSRVGTYLIKAVTKQGLESEQATTLVSEVPGLTNFNVVELFHAHPQFLGSGEGTAVSGGRLTLGAINNEMSLWPNLSELTSLTPGVGSYALEGTRELSTIVDLGEVYPVRLTAEVDAFGQNWTNVMSKWLNLKDIKHLAEPDPGDWNVVVEYRKKPYAVESTYLIAENGDYLTTEDGAWLVADAPATEWSPWQQLSVADVLGQHFQFRVYLQSGRAGTIRPVVRRLTITLDMPDRVEGGNDVAVPSGGLRIVFDPRFKKITGFAVNDQDMQTGDYRYVWAKDETGFSIVYVNSAGVPVARTMDYMAKGYGRAA